MRLVDADALKDWSEIVPLTDDGGIDINDFDEKLMSMPTVDAVPVIRCKDCVLWNDADSEHFAGYCTQGDYEKITFRNEWCCWAERKEE